MKSVKGFSIHDRDKGYKALKKTVEEFKGKSGQSYAKAGILGSDEARADGSISNVELAMIHEFGAPSAGIPERSFLRSSFDKHQAEYETMLRQGLEKVFLGEMRVDQVLGLVGAKAAADIKAGVTQGSGIPPQNSPRTLEKKWAKSGDEAYTKRDARNAKRKKAVEGPVMPKKSPRTLVDTGQMIGSVTWEVVGQKAQHGGGEE